MGSYSGTCEIVEAEEQWKSVQHSRRDYRSHSGLSIGEKDKKPAVVKLGPKDSLVDDINQLFEAISLKSSSKGLISQQSGASTSAGTSPLRKNALKKPVTAGMLHSPRIGVSEPVSLKQALRDLCISKASEMAAMKRMSVPTSSPRISEAGRIKSLYNSVVVEDSGGSSLRRDKDKDSVAEVSLVREENKSNGAAEIAHQFHAPKINSSNFSVHSSRFVGQSTQISSGTTSNLSAHSSSQVGPSTDISSLSESITTETSATRKTGTRAPKVEKLRKEKSTPHSSADKRVSKLDDVPVSTKLPKKASTFKPGWKGRLHAGASSSNAINGNKASKVTRNAPRIGKPVLKNRISVKRKKRLNISIAGTSETYSKSSRSLDPNKSQLICQNCQCALKSASNESNQDSSVNQSISLSTDVSSSNMNSVSAKPASTAIKNSGSKSAIPRAKKSPKSSEKGEFSQSSGSLGDSSSTSISDDSNISGSSCGNRPHMSKDVRWEAIRHDKMQHGGMGLSHFNLLRKLGCGDIGTVYLAELIGTDCLFAIKVMDNEFLARRKKMSRAQTEREILRMLDHPFLPTLYSQFTSDNLSCLVMEYCPGGDLHVLRQRQPGRCFPEPSARFYVAEVLLALEYLHMLGVIYRDLKPENIMVREDGHIMLTDFDLSLRCSVNPTLLKSSSNMDPARVSGPCTQSSCIEPFCIAPPSCQVACFSPRFLPAATKARKQKADLAAQMRSLPQLVAEPTDARSNSFVGTHEYLAPEIIKGEGHGAAVDWWTFGVLLYELLYGRTPFKGSGNEETLANVVLQSLHFPDSPLVSFHARDLIRRLLVKEPENRLGTEKGSAEIKQHPFFDGLNWALIRCAVPPELPEFYEYSSAPSAVPQGSKSKYLECKATGEHLEFELF